MNYNIISYVRECKHYFKEILSNQKDYLIVTGNESLDMDSFVSSITFSYLLHCLQSKKIITDEGKYQISLINYDILIIHSKEYRLVTDRELIIIPIIPLNGPNEFNSRKDILFLMDKVGIDKNDLIYLNDETKVF